MEEKIIKTVEKYIEKILDKELNTESLDSLYKLSKIKHITKEDKEMYENYGNYGGRAGYNNYGRNAYGDGSYGEYGRDSYGRRGYDMKYRGNEELNRMNNEYGRYMESRERYGAGEESDKSFHYMVKSLEDFIKVLYEEVQTPQQKQMLNETLQKSIR